MKCIRFSEVGHPAEVLTCVDVDPPEPGPGEVRVRMLASPVNPSDVMFIRGVYGIPPSLPQIPGFEGVGVVEASGGGLKGRLFQGKQVAVLNQSGGNWAEYAVLPAAQVIPLSQRLSVEQAATFFVNPATAWIITQEVLRIPRGAWLLQTAANSSLGRMVIRLGKRLGFKTLNIVRNDRHVEQLKSLGASEVIVFDGGHEDQSALAEHVQRIVGHAGLRHAMDPVGGSTAAAVLESLSLTGRLVLYGTLSEDQLSFSPRTLMKQQASVEGFWLGHFMQQKSLLFKLRLIRRITHMILDGTLASEVAQTCSLEKLPAAIGAECRQHGKLLLTL